MFLSLLLFARKPHRNDSARIRKARPNFVAESLEARDLPAGFANPNFDRIESAWVATTVKTANATLAAASTSLGQKMANYLQSQVNAGKRIGGGECAHLATEALRAAGADFTRTESSGTQDYVWTTNRIARLTQGSQLAGKTFQVGDIIQYHNATFKSGGSGKLAHHTQVVAAVDSKGRITHVFEQNVNGVRTARKSAILDLSKLNGGSVSIYRPVARKSVSGTVEFTVVNNTSSSRTISVAFGSKSYSYSLDKANTARSYSTYVFTFTGSTGPSLKYGSTNLKISDAGAYELYSTSGGGVGLRKI